MSVTYKEKTEDESVGEKRFFPDMTKNQFDERLKFAMSGSTNTSVADMCGVSESTIRSYLSGKTTPTLTILNSLSKALNVPATWFVSGRIESNDQPKLSRLTNTLVDDDFVMVNDLSGIEAAAGGGTYVTDEDAVGHMAFRREWLAREGLKAQALRIIRARGDSMEPTIQDGAPILVEAFAYTDESGRVRYLRAGNTPEEVVTSDGIYVIRLNERLLVKRLQLDMLGGLLVKSDNASYDTLHVPADRLDDIAVIGRVVWTGRKL